MSFKKSFKYLAAIVSLLTLSISAFAYTYEQTATTTGTVKQWLKTPDNTYVEYDYGTRLPNDDAWLKAEVNASTYKYSYCYAKFGVNGTASASGTVSNNYHAIAEVSGIDYFNPGSYAEARNSDSKVYLKLV